MSPALQLHVQLAAREAGLPRTMALTAELSRVPDGKLERRLRSAGAELVQGPEGPRHIGRLAGLRADPSRISELLALEEVLRLDAPGPVMAFSHGAADNAAHAHEVMERRLGQREVHWMLDSKGRRIQGHGVTAAVVDFNLDPFHPSLFHADGGAYPWIDLNGNGRFDPGNDGVDLDGDGKTGATELLQLLEFPVVVPRGMGAADSNADGAFTPFMDYLFVDTNKDGSRNVGDEVAATSQTPGLSEPTFVADDANENGVLDVGEKLLRLGSAKVKLIYDLGADQAYAPGPGFTTYLDAIRSGQGGQDIEFHGTYECTRVAGGHAEIEHMGGIAPGADLVFIDINRRTAMTSDGDMVTGLTWLKDHGARAFNYAFGEVASRFADGSSVIEQALSELEHEGIPQSASAGNDASTPNHGIFTVPARGAYELKVQVGYRSYAPQLFFTTLRWRGPDTLTLRQILSAEGTTIPDPPDGPVDLSGTSVYVSRFGGNSPRDTHMIGRMVSTEANNKTLPRGEWTLYLENRGGSPLEVDVWASTDMPFPIVQLVDESVMTSEQTVTHPATADDILTVGACSPSYAGRSWSTGPTDCSLAPYSSLGPRIDGVRQVALVAPTDMLSGYPLLKFQGGYLPFGGTSGASPHVTGTAALVLQMLGENAGTGLSARILSALYKGAELDTLPNIAWGEGLLNAWSSAFPDQQRSVRPTDARLGLYNEGQLIAGAKVRFSVRVPHAAGILAPEALIVRADAGYDGSYETGPFEGGSFQVELPEEPGTLALRVQAMDGQGQGFNGLFLLEIAAPEPEPGPDPFSADAAGSPDTGAVAPDLPAADSAGGADPRVGVAPRAAAGSNGCGAGSDPAGVMWLLLLSAQALLRRRRAISPSR